MGRGEGILIEFCKTILFKKHQIDTVGEKKGRRKIKNNSATKLISAAMKPTIKLVINVLKKKKSEKFINEHLK